MRTWDRLLIGAFLVIVTLPGVGLLGGIDGSGQEENRQPAPPPEWPASWEAARAWPDAFTRYFEDHFTLRAPLVETQAAFRLDALGVSPTVAVIAGRDGWFYYAEDSAVEDYTVAWQLSDADLETWREALQDTQDWLAAQGISYAFVIAPDKHVIYPEPMPAGIRRLHDESWTDQLVAHLRAHSSVNVVDLRPVLLAARARERVYHKTDTHWNDRGAHAAYVAIVESLKRPHGLVPAPRAAFEEVSRSIPGMDLAGMLGLKDWLVEEDLALVPRQPRRARMTEPAETATHGMYPRMVTEVAGGGTLPRAVIFRDSFASGLVPFLSEHFSRALYLWEYDVNPMIIAAEKPQVVIQQIVGRHLGNTLPYNYIKATRGTRDTENTEEEMRSGGALFTDTSRADRARSGVGAATRSPVPAPVE